MVVLEYSHQTVSIRRGSLWKIIISGGDFGNERNGWNEIRYAMRCVERRFAILIGTSVIYGSSENHDSGAPSPLSMHRIVIRADVRSGHSGHSNSSGEYATTTSDDGTAHNPLDYNRYNLEKKCV